MTAETFIFGQRFIASLDVLPKETLPKLRKCLKLLAKDRQHPGLNDEGLKGWADGLRSARLDDKYRLVYEEQSENQIVLHLVGKHDEVYRQAERMAILAVPASSIQPPAPASLLRLITPRGKKYLALSKFLAQKLSELRRIDLSFAEIIVIIGAELPKSAYLYSAWWANDPSHVQAAAWLIAGWKATNLALVDRRLTFEQSTN